MAHERRKQLGLAAESIAPLHITATLYEGLVAGISGCGAPFLDSMLTAVVAIRERLIPPSDPRETLPIEIPIAQSECRRVYLCSSGLLHVQSHDFRHKHKRAPCTEYARIGAAKITRVDQSAAEDKSYRVPYNYELVHNNTVEWWCFGDRELILEMLRDVHALGKFRGSGKGRIREWQVEICEPWGDGFPVLRNGEPMRPLPLDYPGLKEGAFIAYHTLRPPYYLRMLEEPCAMPRAI